MYGQVVAAAFTMVSLVWVSLIYRLCRGQVAAFGKAHCFRFCDDKTADPKE